MTLYFITGNPNKVKEVKKIIPDIEQIELNLPELQELDPEKIIAEKLNEAKKQKEGKFFVEDTSMYIDCLNGFPGPLIKWLKQSLNINGIAELVHKYENKEATVKTVIGYTDRKDTYFFTGELKGTIVSPRGDANFGFDPIFQPEGHDKTMAEMTPEEKNSISMRKKALTKLKKHLQEHGKI